MADADITSTDSGEGSRLPEWLTGRLGLVAAALAIMWGLEVVDTGLGGRLDAQGIRPRRVDGLDGILWSPFLHDGFRHLISNTIPFAVLSGLVLLRGPKRWINASIIIILLGGLLVWGLAIGSNEVHIGASGWVFGLFGFLVASAFFERRPLSIGIGLVTLFLYGGTILFGFVPRPGLSWEAHLFGFIAGIIAARILTSRSTKSDTGSGGSGLDPAAGS